LGQESVANPLLGTRYVTVTGSLLESGKTTNACNWLSAQGLERPSRFQLSDAIFPTTLIRRARHKTGNKIPVSKRKLLALAFVERLLKP
jgi:hypothetical protein